MIPDEEYMQRCIDLAAKAAGYVAPNPMVGAVLVHHDKIIGEGFHRLYGEAHAEVNCIRQAEQQHTHLLAESTMYVSLEPCAHFGKTPPCADLLIKKGIKKVVVGCRDPFLQVNGKGIDKLRTVGIEVTEGVLEKECMQLNKRFFTFHTKQRPYIILKWAASADNRMAAASEERTLISGDLSNRLVHRWRSEEAAILVGTNTALKDNPSLTTRLWKGKNPLRLVLDRRLKLPASLQVFDQSVQTIVLNDIREEERAHLHFVLLDKNLPVPEALAKAMYKLNIQSVIIEGGSILLQSFIDAGLWDEARIITNNRLLIGNGVKAPVINTGKLISRVPLESDTVSMYTSPGTTYS